MNIGLWIGSLLFALRRFQFAIRNPQSEIQSTARRSLPSARTLDFGLWTLDYRFHHQHLEPTPLDGAPAKQITDFRDSTLSSFTWSQDGKQLAASRGIAIRDASLISDAK